MNKKILIMGLVLAAVFSIGFEKAMAAYCYPNPSGQCNICCKDFNGDSWLNVYSPDGHKYSGGYINPQGTGVIDMSRFSNGIWLLKTSLGKNVQKSAQGIVSGNACYTPQYTTVTTTTTYGERGACSALCGGGTQSKPFATTITSSGGVCGEADSIVTRQGFIGGLTCNTQACPPITYTLTTSATEGNIYPSSGTYNSGASVSLTAVAAPGYSLNYWSGDASGSANPISITMDGNKSVTANFVINTYTLTTGATKGGSVQVR